MDVSGSSFFTEFSLSSCLSDALRVKRSVLLFTEEGGFNTAIKMQIDTFLFSYSLMHKKTDKSVFNFFIYKKFKKQLDFLICILSGDFFNESSKEFWKNSNFEKMRAGFLSLVFS